MRLSPPAPLPVLLETASRWVMQGLLAKLRARGHDRLTEGHLMLIVNLDCGTTHASAVAQRMGVSRQAVFRTTRELQALGLLTLEADPARGNQKIVVMTESGSRLALDARAALAEIDAALAARLGPEAAARLRAALEAGWGEPPGDDGGATPPQAAATRPRSGALPCIRDMHRCCTEYAYVRRARARACHARSGLPVDTKLRLPSAS
jgi:DNA-binding MarR family transcriptional regulator